MFNQCTDYLNLCQTNLGGNLSNPKSLLTGQKYFFQIATTQEDQLIPAGYYCNFTFNADYETNYLMTVQRYSRYSVETLMLRLKQENNVENLTDSQLLQYGASILQYKIFRINGMSIYAKNNYRQKNSTFIITIQAQDEGSNGSVFGVISLVLFILMGVFILICAAAIIRVCLRRRRYSQVVQNQLRNRESRTAIVQIAQLEETMQIDRLKTLIGLIKEEKFEKAMDEFKQNECVICFEDFQRGKSVRKLPTCKHLFHTNCIDGWFKSKITEAVHKCPLCNGEISIDKIKEAIIKRRQEKLKEKDTLAKSTTMKITQNPNSHNYANNNRFERSFTRTQNTGGNNNIRAEINRSCHRLGTKI
ncbi:ring-h2 finger protein [Stylonychia lemnae]|uniref:Ring-h2 finger protein n=1 Tax=Stylonychia lemnae TaxID=5949 RepID=A0A078AL12_STYLE|nr:ring-h2 finger protein [Stylonychia lemnae]|eukprot:CDW81538.1 ring-h2 finger protein [Stylonychia lemnae]